MRFKSATKPLLAAYNKLCDEREAASMAIYEAAHPRMDIPWQTCFRDYADDTARERYLTADSAVSDFQFRMAHEERRGYFKNGRFNWY